MKNLQVYLTFPGTCLEALNFYKDSLGGEITSVQTFGESPMQTEAEHASRIMHARFESEGIFLMASDSMPGSPYTPGKNISLNIDFSDEAEQETVFSKLAEGGRVGMPLQDTFWGAKFGSLTDKFGINWMVNCNKPVETH